MRPAGLVIGALALALGLASEAVGYGLSQPSLWIPDLVVGLVWCLAGLRLSTDRPRVGALALGVGTTWFLAGLVPATVFWHRGLLIHLLLILAFPGGSRRGRVRTGAVALAYLCSVTPVVWQGEVTTIAAAGVLLVIAAGLGGGARHTMLSRAAQSCLVVTCLVLVASALTRLAAPTASGAALPTLLAYEATLVVVALVLVAVAVAAGPESVADRVIELSDGPASTLRDALAEVLEDPALGVGYWREEVGAYTDLEGREVVPPPPGSGRACLPIEDAGRPVALVVHDAALRGDPRLAAAVGVATRLATANADLRARVNERREELAASRRRLVRTAVEERADLASLLQVGPRARLTELLDTLREVPDPPTDVVDAMAHAAGTLEDLARWERGLHPRDLEKGLGPALESLAGASRFPVTATVSGGRLPPTLEAAIYYVCAEALTNVAKHAAADSATVTVSRDGDLVSFEVTDDGAGGADPDGGTGLRGARDRLEAFGGSLTVTSAPGDGTRLSGMVPLSPGEHPVSRSG